MWMKKLKARIKYNEGYDGYLINRGKGEIIIVECKTNKESVLQ